MGKGEHSDEPADRHMKSTFRAVNAKSGGTYPILCPINTNGLVSSHHWRFRHPKTSDPVGNSWRNRYVSVYRPLAVSKEGHSGDDSVASGMPYRRKHIGVRVCKRRVLSEACRPPPF